MQEEYFSLPVNFIAVVLQTVNNSNLAICQHPFLLCYGYYHAAFNNSVYLYISMEVRKKAYAHIMHPSKNGRLRRVQFRFVLL